MSERDKNGINTIKNDKYKSLPISLEKSRIILWSSSDIQFHVQISLSQGNSKISGLHHTLALCFFVPCVFAGPQTLPRDRCRCQIHKSLPTWQWVRLTKYFRYLSSCVARLIDGSKKISKHPWTVNKAQASVSLFVRVF